jgi:hypothetical protein
MSGGTTLSEEGIPGPATYHGAHCDFGAFGKLCHDGLYKDGMEWIECNRTRHFFLFDCRVWQDGSLLSFWRRKYFMSSNVNYLGDTQKIGAEKTRHVELGSIFS